MGLTYVQMTLQTNTSLTAVQKVALQNFINVGSQVALAFQATPGGVL